MPTLSVDSLSNQQKVTHRMYFTQKTWNQQEALKKYKNQAVYILRKYKQKRSSSFSNFKTNLMLRVPKKSQFLNLFGWEKVRTAITYQVQCLLNEPPKKS